MGKRGRKATVISKLQGIRGSSYMGRLGAFVNVSWHNGAGSRQEKSSVISLLFGSAYVLIFLGPISQRKWKVQLCCRCLSCVAKVREPLCVHIEWASRCLWLCFTKQRSMTLWQIRFNQDRVYTFWDYIWMIISLVTCFKHLLFSKIFCT